MPQTPPTTRAPHPEIISSETFAVERKTFRLDLKENPRGRFLKITEDLGGRREIILLPESGFEEFAAAFDRLRRIGS